MESYLEFRRFLHIWAIILCFNTVIWSHNPIMSIHEVSIVRMLSSEPGIYFREFDLLGGKADFSRGTSLAGPIIYHSPTVGLSDAVLLLPLSASGLSGRNLQWEPNYIGLGAHNGRIVDVRPSPTTLDTPQAHIHWQRTAFGGNNFALDFRRMLMPAVMFDLDIKSQSTDSSGYFRYLDQTHQLFVGVLGRDSSSIPFNGRNLRFDAFNFNPQITAIQPWGHVGVQVNWLRQHSDDATLHHPNYDSYDYNHEYTIDPYQIHIADNGLRFFTELRPFSEIKFDFDHHYTTLQHRYENTPIHTREFIDERALLLLDSSQLSPSKWYEKGEVHYGSSSLTGANLGLKLSHSYQTQRFSEWLNRDLQTTTTNLWQDEQAFMAQWAYQFRQGYWLFYPEIQGAAHRLGDNEDQSFWEPAWSAGGTVQYAQKWTLQLAHRQHPTWPHLRQSYMAHTGRLSFPNAKLIPETHYNNELTLSYQRPKVEYGLRFRHEVINAAIRPGWMAYPQTFSLPDSIAFKHYNYSQMGSYAWAPWLALQLGNWNGWIERENIISSWIQGVNSVSHAPKLLYKGGFYWNNRVVQDRLGLHLGWDFQWMSGYDVFSLENPELLDPVMPQQALRMYIPHHLSLNFDVRMQIQSFQLYGRIDNMNHTQKTYAAGYTPPGIVFSYGIVWLLQN